MKNQRQVSALRINSPKPLQAGKFYGGFSFAGELSMLADIAIHNARAAAWLYRMGDGNRFNLHQLTPRDAPNVLTTDILRSCRGISFPCHERHRLRAAGNETLAGVVPGRCRTFGPMPYRSPPRARRTSSDSSRNLTISRRRRCKTMIPSRARAPSSRVTASRWVPTSAASSSWVGSGSMID